jgi:hypothetical protein
MEEDVEKRIQEVAVESRLRAKHELQPPPPTTTVIAEKVVSRLPNEKMLAFST